MPTIAIPSDQILVCATTHAVEIDRKESDGKSHYTNITPYQQHYINNSISEKFTKN